MRTWDNSMKTTDLLDQIRAERNLPSAYALSQYMSNKYSGWNKSSVNFYYQGKILPGEQAALDIAAELGLPQGYVLAIIAEERSKEPAIKQAWQRVAEQLRGAACVILAGLVFGFSAPKAEAVQSLNTTPAAFFDLPRYTLCEVRRRLRRALRRRATFRRYRLVLLGYVSTAIHAVKQRLHQGVHNHDCQSSAPPRAAIADADCCVRRFVIAHGATLRTATAGVVPAMAALSGRFYRWLAGLARPRKRANQSGRPGGAHSPAGAILVSARARARSAAGLAAICLCSIATGSLAQPAITLGCCSQHYSTSETLNETNPGFAIETNFTGIFGTVGVYVDSRERTTQYAGLGWRGRVARGVYVGPVIGARTNKDKWLDGVIAGVVTLGSERAALQMVLSPYLEREHDSTAAVIWLQLRIGL